MNSNTMATLEYEDAEDYLKNDSYEYGYKSYINNQKSTFDESYYYYNKIPARDHTSYNRIDYTPLNPPYENENNRIQQEIKNLRDNYKRMTRQG